ncbi:MAG TPA: T9SS type A sorting domain-containing protein [Flavipsychrobacter sp.]|nr:T9SS type A sorting domain-containing protein [Flavipsychrobacter sp.]
MKKIIILLLLTTAATKIFAQGTPAFVCDTTSPNIERLQYWHEPFDAVDNICQSIYYKSDFATMPPQGFITDIFIKIAYVTPAGSTLPGLTVKMGITNMNNYPIQFTNAQFFSMDSTLTTVYYDTLFVLPATIPTNGWLKLNLPQPFQYSMLPLTGDIPQNLVVQLSKSEHVSNMTYKFDVYEVVYKNPHIRKLLRAQKNVFPGHFQVRGGASPSVTLIGFNGYALSVDDPQKKIPFSVFPNPASDKVHLSNEASGMYEVYNLSGIKVSEGKVNEGEEVNVQNLSPGMYLLRMGGETVRFVKE